MTTNIDDLAPLIEKIVSAVDQMYERVGASGGMSAYDYVLELAEPVINPQYTEREMMILAEIHELCVAHFGKALWPDDFDPVLHAMDDLADNAND